MGGFEETAKWLRALAAAEDWSSVPSIMDDPESPVNSRLQRSM